MKRGFNTVILLIAGVCLGCSDGRPTAREARDVIQDQYPGVKIVNVRNTMDEVVATAFEFTYATSNGIMRQREIQFMADETGRWLPKPGGDLEVK